MIVSTHPEYALTRGSGLICLALKSWFKSRHPICWPLRPCLCCDYSHQLGGGKITQDRYILLAANVNQRWQDFFFNTVYLLRPEKQLQVPSCSFTNNGCLLNNIFLQFFHMEEVRMDGWGQLSVWLDMVDHCSCSCLTTVNMVICNGFERHWQQKTHIRSFVKATINNPFCRSDLLCTTEV